MRKSITVFLFSIVALVVVKETNTTNQKTSIQQATIQSCSAQRHSQKN
jgi:hypothetical protein